MKPPKPLGEKPPDAITDLAVGWLLEAQEGFAPGRAAEFQAWRQADPRHALAVTKAERTLALLGELPDLKETLSARLGEETEMAAEAEVPPGKERLWGRIAVWAAVAAVLALAAVTTTWRRSPEIKAPDVSYVSNTNQPQQLVLNDGSFVDLNANTTIRTQMLPRERRIVLQEGEAHFAVAHDTSRPFIVNAAGIAVRAVGTAFNVRVSGSKVEVLVLEGRVEISDTRPADGAAAAAWPQLGIADRAVITRTGTAPALVVEKAGQDELHEARAWHSSVTIISSRPLREIVDLFNRRNTLRLVIDDPELAARNLGGSFSLEKPKTLIRALEIDGDVIAEPRGENEVVLRRRP